MNNWTYPPNIDNSFTEYELCYCTDSSSCSYPSGLYPNLTGFDSYGYYGIVSPPMKSSTQLQGLYVGCMPFDSIMKSTLECFYNEHCLSQLFFYVENIHSLNFDVNSVYSNDTKIDFLIQQLFVENISITKNFESLYLECKPNKCFYSYSSNGNLAFIILTILSLIGGLYVVLQVMSIFIIQFYQKIKIKCSERSTNSQNDHFNLKTMYNRIYQFIINFNLFEEIHYDEYRRRNEILSTRVYILLMIIGFIVIVLYASIVPYTLTYAIKSPPIDIYRQFVSRYPSLTVECQQTISNYAIFISFSPRFHQFCSSLWMENSLIPHFSPLNTTYTITGLVPSIAKEIPFYGIRILCSFAKEVINESITTYLKTTYLSTYLTHENEFISSINISINNLKISLPTITTQFLQLMQDVTQGNQILSGVFSNAKIVYNKKKKKKIKYNYYGSIQ